MACRLGVDQTQRRTSFPEQLRRQVWQRRVSHWRWLGVLQNQEAPRAQPQRPERRPHLGCWLSQNYPADQKEEIAGVLRQPLWPRQLVLYKVAWQEYHRAKGKVGLILGWTKVRRVKLYGQCRLGWRRRWGWLKEKLEDASQWEIQDCATVW